MRARSEIKFNVPVNLPSGLEAAARSAPTVRRCRTKTAVVEKSNERCFVQPFNENNNRRFSVSVARFFFRTLDNKQNDFEFYPETISNVPIKDFGIFLERCRLFNALNVFASSSSYREINFYFPALCLAAVLK